MLWHRGNSRNLHNGVHYCSCPIFSSVLCYFKCPVSSSVLHYCKCPIFLSVLLKVKIPSYVVTMEMFCSFVPYFFLQDLLEQSIVIQVI
jgi:hypothetical protein